MRSFSALQFLGPVALFAAFAASDAAAYALRCEPSREWLWRLNLNWFDMFQQSHYALRALIGGDHAQLAFIALPLLAAGVVGVVYKRSLLLALSSNLSFVYIIFVIAAWAGLGSTAEASLSGQLSTLSHPEFFVLAPLVGLSLVSFVVSHVVYFRKARDAAA